MRYALFWRRDEPIHPDIESLVRYRDGQLLAARRKAILRHLSACPECRLAHHRLTSASSSSFEDAAQVSALDENRARLAGLLAEIRGWEAAAARAGPAGEGIKRRVAGQVEKYLGAPATGKILLSVSDDGGNLLSTIEPVLALYLGRTAASRFVSRLVDARIVGI